jgi:hypothetical protein
MRPAARLQRAWLCAVVVSLLQLLLVLVLVLLLVLVLVLMRAARGVECAERSSLHSRGASTSEGAACVSAQPGGRFCCCCC